MVNVLLYILDVAGEKCLNWLTLVGFVIMEDYACHFMPVISLGLG